MEEKEKIEFVEDLISQLRGLEVNEKPTIEEKQYKLDKLENEEIIFGYDSDEDPTNYMENKPEIPYKFQNSTNEHGEDSSFKSKKRRFGQYDNKLKETPPMFLYYDRFEYSEPIFRRTHYKSGNEWKKNNQIYLNTHQLT